jgi:small subunit ribosomal protein S20
LAKKKLSSLKRARQSEKRRLRNLTYKSAIKTYIKKTKKFILEKKFEEAEKYLKMAIKKIDKAKSKGILHPNTANRKKSRLMKFFNKVIKEQNLSTA